MSAVVIAHPLAARIQDAVDAALAERHLLLARHDGARWHVVVDHLLPDYSRELLERNPNVAGPLILASRRCG